jgi:glutaconyl-CoA/methylmalonyl-CoA decarboxylase subunit gamma
MKKLLITVNGKRYEVDVEVLEDDELIQTQPLYRPPARVVDSYITPPGPAPVPKPRPRSEVDQKTLTSPLNGTMLEVHVEPGQEVAEGQVVFVVEAMKMKTNIASPVTGRVKEVPVKEKDVIEQGQLLLRYE